MYGVFCRPFCILDKNLYFNFHTLVNTIDRFNLIWCQYFHLSMKISSSLDSVFWERIGNSTFFYNSRSFRFCFFNETLKKQFDYLFIYAVLFYLFVLIVSPGGLMSSWIYVYIFYLICYVYSIFTLHIFFVKYVSFLPTDCVNMKYLFIQYFMLRYR